MKYSKYLGIANNMTRIFLLIYITLSTMCLSGIADEYEKILLQTDSLRYEIFENGIIIDAKTGLMWASKDNGYKISWHNARSYCENFKGGGFSDWRMPTQKELATLYDKKIPGKYHITSLIKLSDQYVWAEETFGSSAAPFTFAHGRRGWLDQSYSEGGRALPVRGGGKK
ncbi:MAG: DUF1566 domain-containing protein [Desulfobacteraceae bacterium]|nr:DUF1566 domain-containing protein [Desulfobacteraceae bacterium]